MLGESALIKRPSITFAVSDQQLIMIEHLHASLQMYFYDLKEYE